MSFFVNLRNRIRDRFRQVGQNNLRERIRAGLREKFEEGCTGCRCECTRACWISTLKQNAFVIALIISVGIGIGMGVGLRYKEPKWTAREMIYLKFPGDLFLRMLKMMILPLVVSSIVSSMSSLNMKSSGKIGGRAVVYYLSTTFVSVIIGIILVVSIRPGEYRRTIDRSGKGRDVSGVDSLLDLLRNCFPSNIVAAAFQKTVTDLKKPSPPAVVPIVNATNASKPTPVPLSQWSAVVKVVSGSNILGIIVFSIAFGIAISKLEAKGVVVRQFFYGMNEAILVVVRGIIWYTPIGIIFLVASKVVAMTHPLTTLSQLGLYIVTVATGLAIHMFLVLPFLYVLIVRRNPYAYLLGTVKALLTALATASSSATLMVTLHCVEDIHNIDTRIARFVVPVGATINMDGTALYEAVASIFIAQVNNIHLNFGQIVIVSLMATAAAIGAAGVPEAGIVTMVIVLEAVGLPTEDITLILAIDWFLDRLRTSTNVWGDAVGAAIVEKLSQGDLYYLDGPPSRRNTEAAIVPPSTSVSTVNIEEDRPPPLPVGQRGRVNQSEM